MKLNLGCGYNKLDGYLNVDSFAQCTPDLILDLETAPWPFESDSVDEIQAHHVLEHMGRDFEVFSKIFQELYRVVRPDGLIRISVPHPAHETFYSDPTHVRAFTLHTFEMMDRARNLDWVARQVTVTPLALMLDVDFESIETTRCYDEPWVRKIAAGEMTLEQVRDVSRHVAGVIREIRVVLRTRKPMFGAAD